MRLTFFVSHLSSFPYFFIHFLSHLTLPSTFLHLVCLDCAFLYLSSHLPFFFITVPSLISNLIFFFVFLFLFFLHLPCALPTRSTDSLHNSTLMVKEFVHFPLSLLQNAWKRRKITRK